MAAVAVELGTRVASSGAGAPSSLPGNPPRPAKPHAERSVWFNTARVPQDDKGAAPMRTGARAARGELIRDGSSGRTGGLGESSTVWGAHAVRHTEEGSSESDEEDLEGNEGEEGSQCLCCLGQDPCDGALRRCCVPLAARAFCVWSALRPGQDAEALTGDGAREAGRSGDATATGPVTDSTGGAGAAAGPRRERSGTISGLPDDHDGDEIKLERRETMRMKEAFSLLESSAFRADEEDEARRQRALRAASTQWLIHPYSAFRTRWDLMLVLIITYNAFGISLRIAFGVSERLDALFWIDRLVDCLFIADLIFNFRTGIVNDAGAVELDPAKIVWSYLKGWFLIDLVSAVPYEIFFIIAAPEAYDSNISPELRAPSLLRIGQIIRIFKAVKMLRLLRLNQVFTRWERAFVVKHAFATLTRFFVAILFSAHWAACLFFLVGSVERSSGNPLNWIDDQGIAGAGLFEQYIAAFYWALTTVTTVGYGDIAAVSPAERIVSVLSIMVGSTLYTYGLTNIITVAVGMQRDKTAFQEKMDALNSYMAHREVPGSLQAKIRTYLAERSSKGRSWDEKERELLSELSPQLQAKVAIVVNRAVLKRTRFLWHTTPEFVTRLILSMAHQHFPPDEYVAVEEDPADKLFILTKGSVDLLKWGRFRVQSISGRSRDAFFGELALLEPADSCVRLLSARTRTHCDVRILPFQTLHDTLLDFPRMRHRVVMALDRVIRARRHDIRSKCKQWLRQYPKARDDFARRSRKRRGSVDAAMMRAAAAASGASGLGSLPDAVPTLAPGHGSDAEPRGEAATASQHAPPSTGALSADDLDAEWVDVDDDVDAFEGDEPEPNLEGGAAGGPSLPRPSSTRSARSLADRRHAARVEDPSQGGRSEAEHAGARPWRSESPGTDRDGSARDSPMQADEAAMGAMSGARPWESVPTLSTLGLQMPASRSQGTGPPSAQGHARGASLGSSAPGGASMPPLLRARSLLALAPSDRQHMPSNRRGERLGRVYGGTRVHAAMLERRTSSEHGSDEEGDAVGGLASAAPAARRTAFKPAATLAGGELEEHARAARAIAAASRRGVAAAGRQETEAGRQETEAGEVPPKSSRRAVMDVFGPREPSGSGSPSGRA